MSWLALPNQLEHMKGIRLENPDRYFRVQGEFLPQAATVAPISFCTWRSATGYFEPPFSSPHTTV
jgi:hypothetical protein